MEHDVEQFILSAQSKALATCVGNIPNVVPVSSLSIVDGKIWLINYFMEKTLTNLLENNKVSLVCWSGFMGYQIKGSVSYKTEGEEFDRAVEWIHQVLPERVVKGLIVLDPQEVHDISPTKDTKEKYTAEQHAQG